MSGLESDVVAYAELSAALADEACDRAATLAAHGLDEDGWDALDDAWQARLWPDGPDDDDDEGATMPHLLVAYAEAFAAAQRARAGVALDFERFVAVARAMRRGADLQSVLARLEVTLASYLAAQRHWTARMIADEALASRFAREVA